MERITDWLNSCSYDDPYFQPADEACQKLIVPFFTQPAPETLEQMITATLKLYKEVQFLRDRILAEQLNVNYVSRKLFASSVMIAWRDKHPLYRSVIEAICYDLEW